MATITKKDFLTAAEHQSDAATSVLESVCSRRSSVSH